jgi:hypothetical protein
VSEDRHQQQDVGNEPSGFSKGGQYAEWLSEHEVH